MNLYSKVFSSVAGVGVCGYAHTSVTICSIDINKAVAGIAVAGTAIAGIE